MRRFESYRPNLAHKGMLFFVYILKSLKDSKFYIGQSNNLEDRIKRHNGGQVRATKHRRLLILVYQETFSTRTESMQREKYLKSLKSSKYILENIIKKQVKK